MTEESDPRNGGGKVNLSDVAHLAGVSPATASRSLRGLTKVSTDTRLRVLQAARTLSYATPARAAGIGYGRRTVAVIVPFVNRWFFGTVITAAVEELRRRGYDVLLYHLGEAEIRDEFFAAMPLAGRVQGILTVSTPLTEEHTLALRALDLPLVSVGSVIPGSASVGIDETAAARSAVRHLLHLGHERIGVILGEDDDPDFDFSSSARRRLGAEQALRAAGLELDERLVAVGPHGVRGGAAAMAQLLAGPVLPTAVFAEYDELAIGALRALHRAGLSAPQDLSVVGIDDHEMAEVLDLTTVGQRVTEQGRTAAGLLVDALTRPDAVDPVDATDAAAPLLLPTELILRGTTAPPASVRRSRKSRAPRTPKSGAQRRT